MEGIFLLSQTCCLIELHFYQKFSVKYMWVPPIQWKITEVKLDYVIIVISIVLYIDAYVILFFIFINICFCGWYFRLFTVLLIVCLIRVLTNVKFTTKWVKITCVKVKQLLR